MKEADIPSNEFERQEALYEYHLLDTLSEKEYDDLTEITAQIAESPISLITLIDRDRNWFKSTFGTDEKEDPRNRSFCGHAINAPTLPFIIENTLRDDRFADNPLVTGKEHIRFYAGIPIVNQEGFALGTLCVMDQKPKTLSKKQIETLQKLASQALSLMEHHRKAKQLEKLNNELLEINSNLESFANAAAHDLESPVASILEMVSTYKKQYQNELLSEQSKILEKIVQATLHTKNLIKGTLEHSKTTDILELKHHELQFSELVEFAKVLVDPKKEHHFHYSKDFQLIRSNEVALKRILINLFSNAIIHNDKEEVNIFIDFDSDASNYMIRVSDNGPGIPKKLQQKVFDIFERAAVGGSKIEGVGIGLATIKKLVNGLGGTISVKNEEREGCTFSILLPKHQY